MMKRLKAAEIGIFAVISLIFLNSVYNLFTDGKLIGDNERRPLALEPASAGRTTSGVRTSPGTSGESLSNFVPYETRCTPTGETFETQASKIRITGPFCGSPTRTIASAGNSAASPIESKIENSANRYKATVFSDHSTAKFSTDFIPLEPGTNKLILEFRYEGGKVHPLELTIQRK